VRLCATEASQGAPPPDADAGERTEHYGQDQLAIPASVQLFEDGEGRPLLAAGLRNGTVVVWPLHPTADAGTAAVVDEARAQSQRVGLCVTLPHDHHVPACAMR
jgi:hypothetical protein